MRTITTSLLLFLVTTIAVKAIGAPTLTVTIEPSKITATGVTPGAQVLIFGAGYEPEKFHAVSHRWQTVVSDSQLKGTVSYALEKPVTWNAIWIVIDLRNGQYAVASTPGFPKIRSDLVARSFASERPGLPTKFVFSRLAVDFVYAGPAGSAWAIFARDGDANDADGKVNGETTIDLLRAKPLAGTDMPKQFTPGGTIFVIDPIRLDILELSLDEAILAGAR